MAIEKAIQHFTTASRFAAELNVSPQTVSQWVAGERPIPLERCLQIERATKGAVKCEDLRPDIDWTRVSEPEKAAA